MTLINQYDVGRVYFGELPCVRVGLKVDELDDTRARVLRSPWATLTLNIYIFFL